MGNLWVPLIFIMLFSFFWHIVGRPRFDPSLTKVKYLQLAGSTDYLIFNHRQSVTNFTEHSLALRAMSDLYLGKSLFVFYDSYMYLNT
jgi:hypothetical protein